MGKKGTPHRGTVKSYAQISLQALAERSQPAIEASICWISMYISLIISVQLLPWATKAQFSTRPNWASCNFVFFSVYFFLTSAAGCPGRAVSLLMHVFVLKQEFRWNPGDSSGFPSFLGKTIKIAKLWKERCIPMTQFAAKPTIPAQNNTSFLPDPAHRQTLRYSLRYRGVCDIISWFY